MNRHDSEYLQACKGILEYGRLEPNDRTGVGRIRVPGVTMRFHMENGYPLLTSARKSFRIIDRELRMFLKGITNNSYLTQEDINIWTPHEGPGQELGPIYGAMWRGADSAQPVDQIKALMHNLTTNPVSSRHIVTGWIPDLLPIEEQSYADNVIAGLQCLPPCHTLWQVHCFRLTHEERIAYHKDVHGQVLIGSKDEDFQGKVLDSQKVPRFGASIQLYQRSADMFLGVPFNIASYAQLLHIICHSLNMKPLELIWNGGDCHIYSNHVEQMNEQISRERDAPPSPTLHVWAPRQEPWLYEENNFELRDYNPMPHIKGSMAH